MPASSVRPTVSPANDRVVLPEDEAPSFAFFAFFAFFEPPFLVLADPGAFLSFLFFFLSSLLFLTLLCLFFFLALCVASIGHPEQSGSSTALSPFLP
jgi:hypothetical protein